MEWVCCLDTTFELVYVQNGGSAGSGVVYGLHTYINVIKELELCIYTCNTNPALMWSSIIKIIQLPPAGWLVGGVVSHRLYK